MKKRIILSIAIGSIIALACSKVPITNRKQASFIPESKLIGMSALQYGTFLDSNKVVTTTDVRTQRVQRVGEKIAKSVEAYLKKNGQDGRLKDFKWEFNLVNDPSINAWCMPGGKVVVYTGIMELATDDDLLAVVMGHEIAHAIARHGNERMSAQMGVGVLGTVLGAAVDSKSQTTQVAFNKAFGLASNLGVLKFSRNHESEADQMGLVFMYMAGYDANKAVDFWQKMSAASGGGTPEFLSTHPSHETRISDIKKFIPRLPEYAS